MRKTLSLFVMTSRALLVGGAALARTDMRASGKLTRIDTAARTFALKSFGHEMDFKLADDATVMAGPRAEEFKALEPGQEVKVIYSEEGSSRLATHVEVASSRSAAVSTAPHPPSSNDPGKSTTR